MILPTPDEHVENELETDHSTNQTEAKTRRHQTKITILFAQQYNSMHIHISTI